VCVLSPSVTAVESLYNQGWEGWISEVISDPEVDLCKCEDQKFVRLAVGRAFMAVPDRASSIDQFDEHLARISDMPWTLHESVSDGVLTLISYVPPGLRVFKGHFPDHPVTPGVLLINWIGYWIKAVLGDKRPLLKLVKLKFSKVVQPMDVISCHVTSNKSNIRFCISSFKGTHASGTFEVCGAT